MFEEEEWHDSSSKFLDKQLFGTICAKDKKKKGKKIRRTKDVTHVEETDSRNVINDNSIEPSSSGRVHDAPATSGKKKQPKLKSLKRQQKLNSAAAGTAKALKQDFVEAKAKITHSAEIPHAKEDVKQPIMKLSYGSKMKTKLDGSRFRWINEQLYTKESGESQAMFDNSPSLFDIYHKGFESQVKSWPINPVDVIIKTIGSMSKDIVVADFGCGEATIAKNLPQQVHSFDLVAKSSLVTPCDMKDVPLADGSVDVAVFCLSLMGVNVSEFLREAHRVLKEGGVLKIAEVVSRFDDVKVFIKKLSTMGFQCKAKDTSNKMFVLMDFEKSKKKWTTVDVTLKPCIYKRR